jgi:hypothetical protein
MLRRYMGSTAPQLTFFKYRRILAAKKHKWRTQKETDFMIRFPLLFAVSASASSFFASAYAPFCG